MFVIYIFILFKLLILLIDYAFEVVMPLKDFKSSSLSTPYLQRNYYATFFYRLSPEFLAQAVFQTRSFVHPDTNTFPQYTIH